MLTKELIEQRDKIAAQLRELVGSVNTDKDERWGEDQESRFRAMLAQYDLTKRETEIALEADHRAEVIELRRQEIRARTGKGEDEQAELYENWKGSFRSYLAGRVTPEDQEVFAKVGELYTEKTRALLSEPVGATSGGPALVAPQMLAELVKALDNLSTMRRVCRVITTSTGAKLTLPTVDDRNEGEVLDETDTGGAEEADTLDPTIGQKTIGVSLTSSKAIPITLSLIQDSAVDIVSEINMLLAERLGRIMNKGYTAGIASTEYSGIVATATHADSIIAGAITYDNLVNLVYGVHRVYREGPGNVGFQMHDDTLKAIRLLKDENGLPIWSPGAFGQNISQPEPERLLGYPVWVNDNFTSDITTADLVPIAFGNWRYYVIHDATGIQIFRLSELQALKYRAVFVGFMRSGGKFIGVESSGKAPIRTLDNQVS